MKKIYFKIKQNSKLPVSVLSYTYKDIITENVIHPFSVIYVDFKNDKENIKKMEDVKNRYGTSFMFFNNSDEGIHFWKNNPIVSFEQKK